MTKMMSNHSSRVLHVIDHLIPASGVASIVMLYITGIKDIPQDVAAFGECNAKMEKTITQAGGKVHKLPHINKAFGYQYSKSFKQLLSDNQYSIVHGHLLNAAFIYLKQAKKHGVSHRIIHSHNAVLADTRLKQIRNGILSYNIPNWANSFIAVSSGAAKCAFGKSLKNLDDVKIIFNGVDTNRFSFNPIVRAETRGELGISDNTLCIGHVGRFAQQKNHDFLIDIFKQIHSQPNTVLLLVGDGHLEETIKSKVNELGLSDCVKFLGSRSDVQRLYQAFDVFLLPSLFEGFPLVAVEAQCAGLGCVLPEYLPKEIKCREDVVFLPIKNPADWAKAALDLANKPRQDGSADVISAKLDIASMCGSISDIYKTML